MVLSAGLFDRPRDLLSVVIKRCSAVMEGGKEGDLWVNYET